MDSVVQWAIWGVLMSIAMGAVVRAWKRQASAKSEGELRHPKVILVVALATGVPFFGLGVTSLIFAEGERWVSPVFFGFSLIGAYLLWEYLQVRYSVSPEGFTWRTLAAGSGSARWDEVTKVSWSASASWFRLQLSGKRVVRVSVLMVGLDRFAEALLNGARGAEIDPSVRELLALCARGLAPSPWG